MESNMQNTPLNILLADDDMDDRYFFKLALKDIPIPTQVETVNDGEKLMVYLMQNIAKLPDVLFLDLNMPRKDGWECLIEIKANDMLKQIPVVIYSTSLNEEVAEVVYKNGAHYYIRKADLGEIKKVIQRVLTLMKENNFARPSRDEFIIR